MMKTVRNILIIFIMVTLLPVLVSCSNNRPSFSNQNEKFPNSSSNNSNPTITNYCKLNLCEGVEVKSINLKINSNNYFVENGSDVKFSITHPTFISTTGKTFYFNEDTDKIISGLIINNSIITISELDNYFTVNSDISVSLVESELSLSAMMICNKYSISVNDTLYKKFNYKSSNFRNSLISVNDDNNIEIDNSIFYLTFDDININNSNISYNIDYDISSNTAKLKIGTFLETTDIAFVFVYRDTSGNIFLGNVEQTSNISHNKQTSTSKFYSCFDNKFNRFCIEFVTYYLDYN